MVLYCACLLIVYDIVYTVIIGITNATCDLEVVAYVIATLGVAYNVLLNNTDNKFKVLLGGTYPARIAEKVYLRSTILRTRAELGTIVVMLVLSQFIGIKAIIWVFIGISTVESIYSMCMYNKYYINLM